MRKTNVFDVLYFIVGLPWLFLMLFTSRMFTEIKVVLLAVIVILCFFETIIYKIQFPKKITGYIISFLLFCLCSLFWGVFLGYEFNMEYDYGLIQNYFLTPLCVLFISMAFGRDGRRKRVLWEALKYLTCSLAVLDVIRVLLYVQGIDPPYFQFIMMASQGMTENLTLRVSNEIALMFLLPIYVFMLLNSKGEKKRDRLLYFIIVFFGLIYSVLSGRKMLEIEVAISVIFSLFFINGKFSWTRIKKLVNFRNSFVLFISMIAIVSISEWLSSTIGIESVIDLAYNTIVNELSPGAYGVEKRTNNTYALLDLWCYSPLWGNGLNSYAETSIADLNAKWSYEVFYIAWLAQTGFVGFILLLISMVYLAKQLRKRWIMYDNNVYGALLIGFLCFVIGAASNPLLYLVWPWSVVLIYCWRSDLSRSYWYNE